MRVDEAKKALKVLLDLYQKYEEDRSFISNEKQVCQSLIFPLINDVLHWDTRDPSVFKVEESQGGKRIDSVVCHQSISQFIVEAKAPSKDILGNSEFYQQALGYGRGKEKDFTILTNFKHLVVLCCSIQFRVVQETEVARIDLLNLSEEDLKLLLCFEHEFWVSQGRNNPLYSKIANRKRSIPIDEELLEDMKHWRELLLTNLQKKGDLDFVDEEELMNKEEEVQKFIDRLIFICFCEDKELEEPKLKSFIYDKKERFSLKPGFLLGKIQEQFLQYRKNFDSDLFDKSDCDSFTIDDNKLLEILTDLKEPKGKVPYDFKSIEADILGKTYENFIGHVQTGRKRFKEKEDIGKRKKSGIYYTPKYIVDYIVNNTVREYIKGKSFEEIKKVKVLDPACGSGSFLRVAFDVLVEESQKVLKRPLTYEEKKELMTSCIFGVDLDKRAVEIAKFNLSLKMAERGKKLPMLNENIRYGNSLIDNKDIARWTTFVWEEEFKEIMGNGGFDVVVGNPPYISTKRGFAKDFKENLYLKNKYKTAVGQFDAYSLFIEKAVSLLKARGKWSYIIPKPILTNENMEKLREILLEKGHLDFIADYGTPFGDANVESVVIVLTTSTKKIGETTLVYMRGYDELKMEKINQTTFSSNPFKMFLLGQTREMSSILKKVESNSINLGRITIIFTRGIEAGKKDKCIRYKDNKQFKKTLRGEDVGKYSILFADIWVEVDKEDTLKFKPAFVYEAAKKILIRRVGSDLKATLDTSKYWNLNTIYNIQLKDNDYEFIVGVLNSTLINFWFRQKFVFEDKLFPYARISQLSQIPIHEIDKSSSLENKLHTQITSLADRVLSLNKRLNELKDKSSSEKSKIGAEIKKTDHEIDELVYNLYGITKEEQKIIEESLK